MSAKAGVLLINLGTPDAPEPAAIRRFLREFLSDPRVVDLSPLIWLPLLYGLILPLRPSKLAPAYQSIWMPEGSPLMVYSQRLAKALGELLPGVPVVLAMRYGWPTIRTALKELELHRPERLLVLPLYPQYSRTTTASVLDGFEAAMAGSQWRPELRMVNDYYRETGYINALRDSVLEHWHAAGRGEKLLMSFHGIPQRGVDKGDPYLAQCQRTAAKLAEALDLSERQWQICFQSRVGGATWTGPYTEETLDQTARSGVKVLDVICPGFSADCLETLEEIAIRGSGRFCAAGGSQLRYIPALNDRPSHAALLADVARSRLND